MLKYREFIGFVFAGGVATVSNYSLFLILLDVEFNYLLAGGIGYLSGVLISYLINLFFVFKPDGASVSLALKYLISYLGALAGQLFLLFLLVTAGLNAQVANAIAIVVVVVANFFVVRTFVFGPPKREPARG